MELRETGRLDESEALFRELTVVHSSFPGGWRGVALIARQRGDRVQALELFRKAAALAPGDFWLQLELATELRETGHLDDAEPLCRKLAEERPEIAGGWRGLAFIARQRGDRDQALEHFRKAAGLAPGDIWLQLDFATELRETGHLDEAELLYAKLTGERPEVAGGWRGLALIARQRGARAQAVEHFRRAAALAPKDIWLQLDFATELRETGHLDEAEPLYRELVEQRPDVAGGWRGLGFIARQRGDRTDALEHFRKAAGLAPNDIWLQFELATELREAGRLDEAEPLYCKLTQEHPQIAGGWRGRAFIARQRGDRARAVEHFRKAASLVSGDINVQLDLATELRETGRADEAEPLYRKLTEEHPESAGGWRGLALIARQRGERAKAIAYLVKASACDPDNLWIAVELVERLLEMGRGDQAEALAKRVVESHPGKALAHLTLANCLRRRGPRTAVVACLENALRLDPDDLHVRLTLASEYLSLWEIDKAERLYDAVLKAHPNHVSAWLGKAQAERRRGRAVEALEACARAYACDPANEWATIEYVRELAYAGRVEESERILQQALVSRPDNPHLLNLRGTLAREVGDFETALATFERLTQIDPASESAQTELASEEFRAGRAGAAMSRLQGLIAVNPGCARALELLADFSMVVDDWSAALAYRTRALEIDRSNIWTHLEIAKLHAHSARFEAADEALAKTVEHFGLRPEIVIVQADVFKAKGEQLRARDALKAGFEAFPTSLNLRFQLIQFLVACGDLAEAESLITAPLQANAQERGRLAMMRGHIAAARWRSADAYEHFNEALAFNPAEIGPNEWAARMALLCGAVKVAAAHNDRARRSEASHRVRHRGGAKPSQSHIGQMIDEYRLDSRGLAALQRALADDAPSERFAGLVLERPDYTPAAISFLVSLRREGRFARRRAADCHQSPIPASIAQYWEGEMGPDIARYCDGWREQNPGFAYRLFNADEAGRFLEDLAPGARRVFVGAREPAMRADLFRLAWLFVKGGYYADADDRCIAPISTLAQGACDLLTYQEDYGTIANNFIGVAPRHPAIEYALKGALEAIESEDSTMIWLSTGPGLMTRSMALYLAEDTEHRLQRTAILERFDLFGAVAMFCAAGYKSTKKHWSRAAFSSGAK